MAAITNSGDGTFKSLTIERLTQEIIHFLQIAESNPSKNTQGVDYVTGNHSQNSAVYNGSFTIPIIQTRNTTTGKIEYSVEDYLLNLNYIVPTDFTFASTNVTALLVEVLVEMENLEYSAVSNPTKVNKVNAKFDTTKKQFSGTIDLDLELAIGANGETMYLAKSYLV